MTNKTNKTALSAVLRGLLGIPLGITIGTILSIIISLVWGNGYYAPCTPELIENMGTEINAVILQTVLCGLLGAAFGAGAVVWRMDRWSLTKQTGIYFLITAAVMLPIAYVLYWMEHSLKGLLGYAAIFAAIFIAIWVVEYSLGRCIVAKMNKKLN